MPTAISELWKNSYDAYAKHVATHIYGGQSPSLAIFDDGHGMTREDFESKWLIVGTESKVAGKVALKDQLGLPTRPRQGQKGIGRLSIAALGSSLLLVSKKRGANFVAALVDWRLFENPYLLLSDIQIPVVDFDVPEDLWQLLPSMRTTLIENLSGTEEDWSRKERLKSAWEDFDSLELEQKQGTETTSARIKRLVELELPSPAALTDWSVWQGLEASGTALSVADLNGFLSRGFTERELMPEIRDTLRKSISDFSDPYSEMADNLDYQVILHTESDKIPLVRKEAWKGIEFLRSLEHHFEGRIDRFGVFRGKVTAFGKDFGEVVLTPAIPPPGVGRDFVGPFDICVGTYEQNQGWSTHPAEVHRELDKRASTHAGLRIYRDSLRVMPYGRPDNDFFGIEERRSNHAGREFWSSRRLFGRIAISRSENPHLRDKAGREGFIENGASRALRILVVELLMALARRYYGSASTYRKEILPGIIAENEIAQQHAERSRKHSLRSFRTALKTLSEPLEDALQILRQLTVEFEEVVKQGDPALLWSLEDRVNSIAERRTEFRLPARPKKLGPTEDTYRKYRDNYSSYVSESDALKERFRAEAERLSAVPPVDAVRSYIGRNQKIVTDQLLLWKRSLQKLTDAEDTRIKASIDSDLKEFYKEAAPLLQAVEEGRLSLRAALDELDAVKERLLAQFASVYESYMSALEQLSSGIDLAGAFSYAEARQSTLETRLVRIQSLAQVGISVEILSHELQFLDRRLETALQSLPSEIKQSDEFKMANQARRELVERLRFLSELQITEGDVRERITGKEIFTYLRSFFDRTLEERSISIEATPDFLSAAFLEYPSRILPVFINIVNNSIYWLSSIDERRLTGCAVHR